MGREMGSGAWFVLAPSPGLHGHCCPPPCPLAGDIQLSRAPTVTPGVLEFIRIPMF